VDQSLLSDMNRVGSFELKTYLVDSARLVPTTRDVVAGESIVEVDHTYGQAAGRAVAASG